MDGSSHSPRTSALDDPVRRALPSNWRLVMRVRLLPTCLDRRAGDTEATGRLQPTRLPTPGNILIDICDRVGIRDIPHPLMWRRQRPIKQAAEPESVQFAGLRQAAPHKVGRRHRCRWPVWQGRMVVEEPHSPNPLSGLADTARPTTGSEARLIPRCATTPRARSLSQGGPSMVSHDPSDIAARGDAVVCREAALPLRARRRTGEAGEHWASEVDRLLSAVGLELEGPSQGAHACHRSMSSPSDGITHRRGRRWVRRGRAGGHHEVRAVELDAMERAEPGQDLLTGAGQAERALLSSRPDPVRVPPVRHARRSGHPTEVHCAE